MMLGVSPSGQFVYAIICFGFGVGGGAVSLLYLLKKINKIERFLVDFFATSVLALLYLVAGEVGGKGQLTFYSLASYLFGIVAFNLVCRKLFNALGAGRAGGKPFKK